MSKRVLALVLGLVFAATLIFTGCERKTTETEAPEGEYKIGIMTGTVSQGEEEFRAAENMKLKYGDKIVITTYPDRFMQEQETTISNMMAMASDPDVKAIVMVQAVPGAAAAVDRVREIRPDMFFLLGVPGEDPDVVAGKGDIILQTNDIARGAQIAQHAKNMGATTLVHYSFPRHMSYEMLAVRRDLMKAEAEKIGLRFVEEDAPDPTSDAGVPGTQQFIMEDIPRKLAQYGPDTAVFGTNCAMMEPMIKQTVAGGGIFPVQCCPSPYHALPAALGIEIPEDKKGNLVWIREEIGSAVAAAGNAGRVATWPVPVNMMYVEAGVDYAIEYLEGRTNGKVDLPKLQSIMERVAGGSVELSKYGSYDNFFLYISDHLIF